MAEEIDVIRHALRIARDRRYAEVEVSFGDVSFEATLQPPAHASQIPIPELGGEAAEPNTVPISAPVVGIYRGDDHPLQLGARVEKGEVVAVVAALGLANEVEAPASGEIVEVLVQHEQPVEYGQTIAILRTS